jgi:hypothetical protein
LSIFQIAVIVIASIAAVDGLSLITIDRWQPFWRWLVKGGRVTPPQGLGGRICGFGLLVWSAALVVGALAYTTTPVDATFRLMFVAFILAAAASGLVLIGIATSRSRSHLRG